MKPQIDERAVKIAMDRLAREITLRKGIIPDTFLFGYREAIGDFIWDYAGRGLKSPEWDQFKKELIEDQNQDSEIAATNKNQTGSEKKNEV